MADTSSTAVTAAATPLECFSSGSSVKLIASAAALVLTILIAIDKLVSAPVGPRKPPVVKGILPIIGHLISVNTSYLGAYEKLAKDATIIDHETGQQYLLKEGVEVQWSASVMHKKPVWGEDGEQFNSEKWLKNTLEIAKGFNESFMPFGGGKHLFPGRNFAFAGLLGALIALAVGSEPEGVQVPEHEMPLATSALCSPIYGSKSSKTNISRRAGWEDVERRFNQRIEVSW
ncbi:prostacyclin synthase [Colletotrichum orchidophilum]|uniref:Prostacyclin synthase n=1 Tax=Colletotrichum orchidophilum TaxID=1209926 RepID=A0A1G4AQB7_9PEZI|nr:prostacyclin synthase [Colletotrichum orchidophilum]OHE91273.1 prostacyclin synthase [Colletotrichum orchidophilum]